MEAQQKKLQDEINKFNESQKKYQKLLKDRQLSDAQLNENKSVYEVSGSSSDRSVWLLLHSSLST